MKASHANVVTILNGNAKYFMPSLVKVKVS